MTQEEYNNLTDEEKNALFATEVLGWWNSGGNWLLDDKVTFPGYQDHYSSPDDFPEFDPYNNLDHAFMGVDKLEDGGYYWTATNRMNAQRPYYFRIWKLDVCTHEVWAETKNEAIMLACLRTKGVLND